MKISISKTKIVLVFKKTGQDSWIEEFQLFKALVYCFALAELICYCKFHVSFFFMVEVVPRASQCLKTLHIVFDSRTNCELMFPFL
jgi:hypothetical protein